MGTFFKVVIYPLLIATFLSGCGGGSGGGSPPGNNPSPTLSDDASLSALTVSTGSFNETFSSGTYAYTQSTNAIETHVTPTLSDANASVVVNGVAVASGSSSDPIDLALGSNTITVAVTAENGSTTRTYSIDIVRLSSDASLSSLSLSTGDLDQAFQSATENYSGSVGFLISSTSVTATTSEAGAGMTIDGIGVPSGVPSDSIVLAEGANSIAITVIAEDGVTTRTYTIELTRQSVTAFAQQAYVKASTTNADHRKWFGYDIALSGDTLAVSARRESSAATGLNGDETDYSARESGAVYVFTRDGAGLWSQEAYIKASNAEANDLFGFSVALSEDTLAVGALGEASAANGVNGDQLDNSAPGSGAVYVFTRDGAGQWSQQAYVKASNSGGLFGHSVDLVDDTLAVGAPGEASSASGVNGNQLDTGAIRAGAVYVFTRDDADLWSQQAYVKASNSEAGDEFGNSVALSGDSLAVGAHMEWSAATGINGNEEDNNAPRSGAVYMFTRNGTGLWSQDGYIKASNTGMEDLFGYSLALSDDTLAVGAYAEGSMATGINGDETNDAGFETGAVYVFVRDAVGVWSQQAYIKASNTDTPDRFGISVALAKDTLAVAAYFEESVATGINGDQADNNLDYSGAAYVFTRDSAGLWSQQAYVKASNSDSNDIFGRSIALSGDTLAVGAYGESSAATGINGDQTDNSAPTEGAAYVFR